MPPETRKGEAPLLNKDRSHREGLRVDTGWWVGQDDFWGDRGLTQGPGKMSFRLAFWDPSVRKTVASSCLPFL